jgi:hypothetical protein
MIQGRDLVVGRNYIHHHKNPVVFVLADASGEDNDVESEAIE